MSGASPIVDVSSTSGAQTLNPDMVNKLIPGSRMYGDMARMIPGLVSTSAPNIGRLGLGSSGTFNAYGDSGILVMIDGFEIRSNTYPDFSSAQEVDVKSFGNSADVAEPGSVWNIVSKSGGNAFHGRYAEQYINDKFQSNNLDDNLRSQGLSFVDSVIYFTDFNADLGGKIVPDKLWFYGAYRHRRNQRSVAGLALTPGADGVYGTGDETPHLPVVWTQNWTGKLSYQPTPKYSLIGFVARDYSINDGGAQSSKAAQRFIPYEAATYQLYPVLNFRGEFRATLRDNLLLNVQVGRMGYTVTYLDTPKDHSNNQITARWDRETGIFTGGSVGPGGNYAEAIRPRTNTVNQANLTYLPKEFLGGGHEFKTGYRMWIQEGHTDVPEHPAGDYQLTYDRVNGLAHQPVEITTFNFPVFPSNRSNSISGYLNDHWQVSRRLTVNLGVRFDYDHSFLPEQTKEQGQFGNAGSFARFEGNTWKDFAPRVGVALDLTNDGKTVIKGTYGIYNGPMADTFAQTFNQNAVAQTVYRWHDLNGNSNYDPGEVNLDVNGGDFLSTTAAANNVFNPDLQRPQQHEVTAVFDRELRAEHGRPRRLGLQAERRRHLQHQHQASVQRLQHPAHPPRPRTGRRAQHRRRCGLGGDLRLRRRLPRRGVRGQRAVQPAVGPRGRLPHAGVHAEQAQRRPLGRQHQPLDDQEPSLPGGHPEQSQRRLLPDRQHLGVGLQGLGQLSPAVGSVVLRRVRRAAGPPRPAHQYLPRDRSGRRSAASSVEHGHAAARRLRRADRRLSPVGQPPAVEVHEAEKGRAAAEHRRAQRIQLERALGLHLRVGPDVRIRHGVHQSARAAIRRGVRVLSSFGFNGRNHMRTLHVLAMTGALGLAVAAFGVPALAQRGGPAAPAAPPPLAPRELQTSIADGFTMASVGDTIVAYPQSTNPDTGFQGVLKLIRDADVATANYEGNIIDGRTFQGTGPGGFGGTPDVAADVKAMGFDLVARSNNHAGEYGYEGLLETNSWLNKAGIVYAGSGEKYASARAARFVSTPKGRVGMVATASSYAEATVATPGRGEWPGRGGQSALHYTRFYMTPPALWSSVKNIREAFPNGNGFYVPTTDTADSITMLGERFKLAKDASKPYYSYQMNETDLRDLMAAVTEGKTRSDFMTFAIHAHQFADTKGGERGAEPAGQRGSRYQLEHRRLPAGAGEAGDRQRRRRVPRHRRSCPARHRDLQGPADFLRARRVLPPDGRDRPVGHGWARTRRGQQPAHQI